NIFIFGMKTPDVLQLKKNGYNPMQYLANNEVLRNAVEFISNGINGKSFNEISSALMNVDQYMALADFADYQKAQRLSAQVYKDKERFARMSLMNISGAGVFSADRSIMDYADRIWNTKPVVFKEEEVKPVNKTALAPAKEEKKAPAKAEKKAPAKVEKKASAKKDAPKKEAVKKAEKKTPAKKTAKKKK
ncbi:MAG: glycogen/starch/alpha-glucan phosphorylase, partial [Eubacterium sp.]